MVKVTQVYLNEIGGTLTKINRDLSDELQAKQAKFNQIATQMVPIADQDLPTVVKSYSILGKIMQLESFCQQLFDEDYITSFAAAKSTSAVSMLRDMRRSVVKQLENYDYELIRDRIALGERLRLIDSKKAIDREELWRLCDEAQHYEAYAIITRDEQRIYDRLAASVLVTPYVVDCDMGTDVTFTLDILVDVELIKKKGYENQTGAAGISMVTIEATKTLDIGRPADIAANPFFYWSPERMNAEKAISLIEKNNIPKLNKVKVDLLALDNLRLESAKWYRSFKYHLMETINKSRTKNPLDFMPYTTILDLWRIKEIMTYKTNQERLGKKNVKDMIFLHKNFVATEKPLAKIYEERVKML